jgi:hypothetical protein
MVLHRTARRLALCAGLALVLPAAAAQAAPAGPTAHAAGGDVPPLSPAIIDVPIQRTESALGSAADAIDSGNGAGAASALTATRRYLLRSYNAADYIIAHPPAVPAEDASANSKRFVRLAKRYVRAAHRGKSSPWIKARAAQDDAVGPVFADAPTAIFNVFTSQYSAATKAVGIAPDTTGQLLAKVQTTLNTAIILRNRLVKDVHAATPAAPPAEDASAGAPAHASQDEEAAGLYDAVMPGLTVLIDDELQQMQAMQQDPSISAEAKAIVTNAILANQQVENLVNQYWPPVVED